MHLEQNEGYQLFLLMTGDKTNARSQYLSAPDEAGALVEWCSAPLVHTHHYNRSTSEPWGTRNGEGGVGKQSTNCTRSKYQIEDCVQFGKNYPELNLP